MFCKSVFQFSSSFSDVLFVTFNTGNNVDYISGIEIDGFRILHESLLDDKIKSDLLVECYKIEQLGHLL